MMCTIQVPVLQSRKKRTHYLWKLFVTKIHPAQRGENMSVMYVRSPVFRRRPPLFCNRI